MKTASQHQIPGITDIGTRSIWTGRILSGLASQRRRFGYRRLGLLLARQGIRLNHKKLCRLYKDERLNEHLFSNLNEARQIIEEWRIDYNTNRPHTSLNGLTPTEFAARPDQGHNPNGLSL